MRIVILKLRRRGSMISLGTDPGLGVMRHFLYVYKNCFDYERLIKFQKLH